MEYECGVKSDTTDTKKKKTNWLSNVGERPTELPL